MSKSSASERTLPLFPGEPTGEAPEYVRMLERQFLVERLEKRLSSTTLKWFRDECGYEDVLNAARALHEANEKRR